jgi:dolichol-phosphate mannosyltransferase
MLKVAIIIPMYNEEEGIPQLFHQLEECDSILSKKYLTHYIFVDDGSKDKTYESVLSLQHRLPNSTLLKHEVNKNLGGALKTGMSHATGYDYVSFLDSDCTYTPQELVKLLHELDKGADLASVSPYHPMGKVAGVPEWRLFLSKSLSYIYRIILHSDVFTYTAMVRAVRSEHLKILLNERNDFTFVALGMLNSIKRGLKIAEVPTTLNVRKFGVSKMNIVKTIRSHVDIILNLMMNKPL